MTALMLGGFSLVLLVITAVAIKLQETRELFDARSEWEPSEMSRALQAFADEDPVFAQQMAKLMELAV